ncbi:hypothetical protein OAG01_00350 [bacterium]|nr:hypothetical protein [bacterium]MDB4632876.1 hypothetical protein [bacterium]
MSTTEDRIENLENRVRRQRRWNIALGAVVVVGGLMAATGVRSVPDVIQAKSFEVVGDKGETLVLLAANPKGDGAVEVRRKGRGGDLGAKVALLGVDESGNGSLNVFNRDGMTMIGLFGADPTGNGSLGVYSQRGKQVFQASPDPDGHGVVQVYNKDGKTIIAAVGAGPMGHGGISVFAKDGKQVVQAASDAAGEGVISVFNKNQKVVASMEVNTDASGIIGVLNNDGEVTAVLP